LISRCSWETTRSPPPAVAGCTPPQYHGSRPAPKGFLRAQTSGQRITLMAEKPLFNELKLLFSRSGIEVRSELFATPPQNAGGLCKMRGKDLILLHSGASKPEQAEALLEVLEG